MLNCVYIRQWVLKAVIHCPATARAQVCATLKKRSFHIPAYFFPGLLFCN